MDPKENLYRRCVNSLKWGLLDKMIGKNKVDVVGRSNKEIPKDKLFYVSGFDSI